MIEDNEFTFEDLVGQTSDQAASIPDSLSFEQLVGEQAIEPTLEEVEQLNIKEPKDDKSDLVKSKAADFDRGIFKMAEREAYDKYKETGENPYQVDNKEFTSEFTPLKLLEMEGYVDNHLEQKRKLNERLKDPNILRSGLADALLNTDMSISAMNALITTAEWAPISAAAIDLADMPKEWRRARKHIEAGEYKAGDIIQYVDENGVTQNILWTGSTIL